MYLTWKPGIGIGCSSVAAARYGLRAGIEVSLPVDARLKGLGFKSLPMQKPAPDNKPFCRVSGCVN